MSFYVFDGQSLGMTPFTSAQAFPAKFMALAHPGHRYAVANRSGTTYAQRDTDVRGRLDWLFTVAPTSVLIDDGGTYDVEDGWGDMTSAQVLATKAAYTAARRSAGADTIVGLTIPPALVLTGGEETIRQEVNTALVADPSAYGYDQIVDVASIPALANANDTTYYFDGTHWTDAATTIVAQALADAGV